MSSIAAHLLALPPWIALAVVLVLPALEPSAFVAGTPLPTAVLATWRVARRTAFGPHEAPPVLDAGAPAPHPAIAGQEAGRVAV